jgi:predicted RNA-binding Zn ribbon-like protein
VDFSHYSDDAVQIAVDLVNTADKVAGTDELSDVKGLLAFLDQYSGEWTDDKFDPGALDNFDLRRVRSLRAKLRRVFESSDVDLAAEILNDILVEVGATPRVSLHSGEAHLHFEPIRSGVMRWLGASTAMGLATVLVDYGTERFGVCDADDCAHAYVDTSRNRSRKHCSTTCANRANVKAHRDRARTPS